jgi:hypothetical protein
VSSLGNLKKAWEGLAGRDALSAILTDDRKAGGKWDVAEFMVRYLKEGCPTSRFGDVGLGQVAPQSRK